MKKVPKLLTPDQVDTICQQQSYPKYRLMIRLLFELALRVGELVAIKKTDIAIDQATIIINGKGSKQRLLPLTERQVEQLRYYLSMYHPVAYLFENCEQRPYTTHGVYNIVREAAYKSGLVSHPHALRHSRATSLIDNNTGLWHVQQLLGHSSLQTTSVYLHYAVKHLRKELERGINSKI